MAWMQVDLDFDATCGDGRTVDEAALDDCIPAPGEPVQLEGTLTTSYTLDGWCFIEGPYPVTDIEVALAPSKSMPDWLAMEFMPQTVVIPASEFWSNPQMEGDEVVWSASRPVSATISQTRDLSLDEQEAVEARQGLQAVFVKAHLQGERDGLIGWFDSFGVEEIRLDARQHAPPTVVPLEEANENTPVGAGILLAPAVAALLRRR